MDKCVGTAIAIKGLFKTHDTNAVKENIQQIICSTAKEWFKKTESKIRLFRLNFSKEKHLSIWHSRTEEMWRQKAMPCKIEEYIKLNDYKILFNFL